MCILQDFSTAVAFLRPFVRDNKPIEIKPKPDDDPSRASDAAASLINLTMCPCVPLQDSRLLETMQPLSLRTRALTHRTSTCSVHYLHSGPMDIPSCRVIPDLTIPYAIVIHTM